MRRRLACVACAVFLAAAGGCKEEGTIAIRSITFHGVQAIDLSRLKSVLATQANSRLPWGKTRYFDRTRFEADLKRIEAYYADRGYPDARVTSYDVKLNQKQDAVDITINVDEGEPIRVAAVQLDGFDMIPAPVLDDLRQRIPLKAGEPRDRQEVVAAHELAVNELRDRGYPYARVTINEKDDPAGHTATLVFTAEPGPIAYFGAIDIAGNTSVGDDVIRRELTYKPGDLYRRSLVQDSQRRLYAMELFQFVNIEVLNPDRQQPQVATRVTIVEGKHQRVNFGVGYGTEEKARVDAEYHHVNFLGGARTAGAHARWSSLDRGLRLDFNQPYVFSPHFSLGGTGQQWYTYTPAYNSVTTGGKATLTHRAGALTSWSVSFTSEHDRSSIAPDVLSDLTLRKDLIALGLDPRTGEQNGTLNAAAIDVQRSTADNPLNAQHGYQIALHVEQAGKILPGTFNYYAVSADARQYLPVGSHLIWANRLQLGTIDAVGNEQTTVPFAKKYFLGGATSIRGWGVYEVSPLSGSGLPLGGDSMLAFSSELRAQLTGKLGAVAFLDGGNVWTAAWDMRLDDLRYAIGPGLRYQTPVGPVRFDFGWQVNPIPGLLVNGQPQTRRWRVHFSIGQAF